MHKGFTKSWRKELNSDIWRMPPVYHRVFYYLRQKACWNTEQFPTKKKFRIILLPGQLITSLDEIANGVSWYEWGKEKCPNRKIILDVLEWLEGNEMIQRESNRYGTFISICNWEIYQSNKTEESNTTNIDESNDSRTDNEQIIHTLKELIRTNGELTTKELSDLKKPNPPKPPKKLYTENFENFWSAMPPQMKVGKKAAFRYYKSSVKNETDYEQLGKALENYKQSQRFKSGHIQNGSTWFNNWRDWVDYKEQQKQAWYMQEE